MKTEIDRICGIMYTLLEHQPVIDVPYEKINDIAVALVKEGYGKVSEYKAEIERLKAKLNEQSRKSGILGYNVTVELLDDEVSEHSVDCNDIEKYAKQFRNRIISINEKEIKQAKIDVLNKAKEKLNSASNGWAYTTYIDELIEEVEQK